MFKCLGRMALGVGSIALGIGTLFLGLAAFYKSSEIYNMIVKINDLEIVVKEIKIISSQILVMLANQNKENTPENKAKLDRILSTYFSGTAVYMSTEKEKIIEHWSSLPSDEDRERYLLNVFKRYAGEK